MPIIVAIFGIFVPRLTSLIIWLFSNWFSAFETTIWPLLGFIFMPYTLLAALYVETLQEGVYEGVGLILVIIGVLMDLTSHGGTKKSSWKKYRYKKR